MATKPRVVRNFWIELEVDGKKEKIATGPRHAGGGFHMVIRMREKGQISDRRIEIDGGVDTSCEGAIRLTVDEREGLLGRRSWNIMVDP